MFTRTIRIKLATAAFCLAIAGLPSISFAETSEPQANLLKVGDKINIIVEGEKDLTGFYTVTKAGTVHVPLIGDIFVAGKTTHEAKSLITDKLQDGYLVKPEVDVKGKPQKEHKNHKKAEKKPDEMASAQTGHGSEEQEYPCKKHKMMHGDKHSKLDKNDGHKGKMCPKKKAHLLRMLRHAQSGEMPTSHVKLRHGLKGEIKDVYIVGAVNKPGLYSLPPGAGHILNIIALAGGYTDKADRQNFEIVRMIDGKYYRKQAQTGALEYHHDDIVIIEKR